MTLAERIQTEAREAMHSAIVLKVQSVEAERIAVAPLAIALEDLRKAVRCLEFVIDRQKEPAQ